MGTGSVVVVTDLVVDGVEYRMRMGGVRMVMVMVMVAGLDVVEEAIVDFGDGKVGFGFLNMEENRRDCD